MNVEIGRQNIIILFGNNEATQFQFWEYINRNQTFILNSHLGSKPCHPFDQFSLQEKDDEEEDEEDEEEEEDAVEAVTEALNDQLMRQKKERGQEERTASLAASLAASSPAPKSILKHSDSSFGLHSPDSLNDDVQVPKVKK
jgi:hypothetical protein